jgi:hypothetical protein
MGSVRPACYLENVVNIREIPYVQVVEARPA